MSNVIWQSACGAQVLDLGLCPKPQYDLGLCPKPRSLSGKMKRERAND